MGISREELKQLIKENIVDSVEAARMLGCSRQNIDDLQRRGKLTPLYASQRIRLYFKPDIEDRIGK